MMSDKFYLVSLLLCVAINSVCAWTVYDMSKSLREYRELTGQLTTALNQSSEALSNTTALALKLAPRR